MSCYIEPREGYGIDDIIQRGLTDRTAVINKYQGGVVVMTVPYSDSAAKSFNAELHPRLFSDRGYYDIRGRFVPLHTIEFPDYLAGGWDPFKQFPCILAEERKMVSESEIITHIIDEKKYLLNISRNRKWLTRLIHWLMDEGFLAKDGDRIIRDKRRMPVGRSRIPIKPGYNPILYQIMQVVKDRGWASRDTISSFIITDINWCDFDPVSKWSPNTRLTFYLKYLKGMKYIREIGRNRYEYLRPLDRN